MVAGVLATYAEALGLRDELKRQIVDEQLTPTNGATARDLGPRFLGSRLGNRDADNEASRWKHVARACWGRKTRSAITRADGNAWLKALKRTRTVPAAEQRSEEARRSTSRDTRMADAEALLQPRACVLRLGDRRGKFTALR